MADDYYAVLEIDRSATSDEVKRAYRKQALRWHPDKNPDNKEEAEERFKKIAEAYEVLSDENKKATYDRFGKRGLNNGGAEFSDEDAAYGFDGNQYFFGGAVPRSRHAHNFMFTDPFEIFRQVFGDEPFMPMDSAFFNGASNRSGSSHRPRNGHNIGTMQTFGFPGFGFPSMSLFGDDPFGGFGGNVQVQSFSSSGGFGGGGSFRSVSSSSRIVNGKQVTTSRIVENGIERVEVKENGELKSVKVNGVEQMVDYRPQQPQRAQTHVHAHSHAHPQHNGYAHHSHPQGHAQDPRASGSASASARRSAHGGSASHSRVDSNERQHEIRSTPSQYDRYADAQPQVSSSKPRKPNAKKANVNQ